MVLRASLLAFALLVVTVIAAAAAPARYVLEADRSTVRFSYTLEGVQGGGTMPIASADLALDFDTAANSTARVVLDAAGARTAIGLITQALKGGDVLDTANHPTITFQSRRFEAVPGGARVTGDVTIRGVTRPLTLDAEIFRQTGTEAGDRSRLTVTLSGRVSRSAFGADGYAAFVDDTVGIDITVRLRRAP